MTYQEPQKNFEKVYQFRVDLQGTKPKVWRRLLIPENYTFLGFAIAIINVMGWHGGHLHGFFITTRGRMSGTIGLPSPDEGFDNNMRDESKEKMSSFFSMGRKHIMFEYDFGDSWLHAVKLEKIIDKDPEQDYPACTKGSGTCPPDDCGGLGGFYNLMDILRDPTHEEYEEMKEWIEEFALWDVEKLDMTSFDVNSVTFENPQKWWKEYKQGC